MAFYKKKPVIVEAHQYTKENGLNLSYWVRGQIVWEGEGNNEYILIPTLEGDMRSYPGDYIVKGSQFEEFWSVKKEIFEATYDRVSLEEGV